MKSKLFFLLAIVTGLLTTFLFYQHISNIEAENVVSENTVEVVVAGQAIAANSVLMPDMLKLQRLPEASVHPNALTSMGQAVGNFTTSEIAADELLLQHRVSDKQAESQIISRKLDAEYRAVSVGVNIVQSVTNMIMPDDYVDVIFSEMIEVRNQDTGKDDKVITSEILLREVKVLAIGRKMTEYLAGEEYQEYTAVTLQLTDLQALDLVNASERGQIQLMLHSRIIGAE